MFFLEILCFNNEGNGYLLEASIYHSNNKKMGIDNFMQISSLQLSLVLCSVLLFSSLENSFCWREPWLLMRAFCRCLASINRVLKPCLHGWRSSPWTLTRLKQNKQMVEDSWYGADTPRDRRAIYHRRKKFSGLGITPSFPSCLWDAVTHDVLHGYFMAHGWLLSYLALT